MEEQTTTEEDENNAQNMPGESLLDAVEELGESLLVNQTDEGEEKQQQQLTLPEQSSQLQFSCDHEKGSTSDIPFNLDQYQSPNSEVASNLSKTQPCLPLEEPISLTSTYYSDSTVPAHEYYPDNFNFSSTNHASTIGLGTFEPQNALAALYYDQNQSIINAGQTTPVEQATSFLSCSEHLDTVVEQDANIEDQTYADDASTKEKLINEKSDGEKENHFEYIDTSKARQAGVAEFGTFERRDRHSTKSKKDEAYKSPTDSIYEDENSEIGALPKIKRTHSVSFNFKPSNRGRNSIDIRNLPSYLHHKRGSIIDVAKGAMSSLISSTFGASLTRSTIAENVPEEALFEEPIAPTLSLGQRVAMIQNDGSEFGTVGWIGRLPDFDKDWVVGVVFDNPIGNCDGEYLGVRYFYSKNNYAMFVPLSILTKTDNYIGRPETGTMLSRMSVQLKPGQLISIQRSSIRLQHCFLNAPHQRVGHDVRAVSNRLHCQCHNCGPCAHLTKQGRGINTVPGFLHHSGMHHPHTHKKGLNNHGTHHGRSTSLAQVAVELLTHHHHHHHDLEESHEETEECKFGDNSAHACNFVRYSCCLEAQKNAGHQVSTDCSMIRPEILDNLITVPRAPIGSFSQKFSRKTNRNIDQEGQIDELIPSLNTSPVPGFVLSQNDEGDLTPKKSGSICSVSSYSSSSSSSEENFNHMQPAYSEKGAFLNHQNESIIINTINTQMSLADQRKFIHRRNSIPRSSHSEVSSPRGIVEHVQAICRCLFGKRQRRMRDKKMSRLEKSIEFRRRNSTFVPSTLAKPQDIAQTMALDDIQDSSNSVPSKAASACADQTIFIDPTLPEPFNNDQYQQNLVNYNAQIELPHKNDSDNTGSLVKEDKEKFDYFDMGYFDSGSDSNTGTLKQLVEKSINEEVTEWIPTRAYDLGIDLVSPVNSAISSENIPISSLTISSSNDDYELDIDRAIEKLESADITDENNEP